MSALDRLMNREAPAEKSVGVLNSSLGGMLAKLIPQAHLDMLQEHMTNTAQWVKDSIDLLTKGQHLIANQNAQIISNQEKIMMKLGITDDGSDDNDGTGNASPGE